MAISILEDTIARFLYDVILPFRPAKEEQKCDFLADICLVSPGKQPSSLREQLGLAQGRLQNHCHARQAVL